MSTLAQLLLEADAIPRAQRLEGLVEFGDELPAPDPSAGELTRLVQCQSPVSWAARCDVEGVLHVAVAAPGGAVVVRGFAGLVVAGLDGRPADELREAPTDLVGRLGLDDAISPLRLGGLRALWEAVRQAAGRP